MGEVSAKFDILFNGMDRRYIWVPPPRKHIQIPSRNPTFIIKHDSFIILLSNINILIQPSHLNPNTYILLLLIPQLLNTIFPLINLIITVRKSLLRSHQIRSPILLINLAQLVQLYHISRAFLTKFVQITLIFLKFQCNIPNILRLIILNNLYILNNLNHIPRILQHHTHMELPQVPTILRIDLSQRNLSNYLFILLFKLYIPIRRIISTIHNIIFLELNSLLLLSVKRPINRPSSIVLKVHLMVHVFRVQM